MRRRGRRQAEGRRNIFILMSEKWEGIEFSLCQKLHLSGRFSYLFMSVRFITMQVSDCLDDITFYPFLFLPLLETFFSGLLADSVLRAHRWEIFPQVVQLLGKPPRILFGNRVVKRE